MKVRVIEIAERNLPTFRYRHHMTPRQMNDGDEGADPPTWAKIAIPTWMWNGKPRRFFESAQYIARPEGNGQWLIRTVESYSRRSPSLIHAELLLSRTDQIDATGKLEAYAEAAGDNDESVMTDQVLLELERLHAEADKNESLIATLSSYQLQTMVIPPAHLGDVVRGISEALSGIALAEDESKQAFPNITVHLVRRDAALLHRTHLPLVQLRAKYDPALAAADSNHIRRLSELKQPVFDSSRNLLDGTLILDAYLGPLLGAISPFIWAIPVYRRVGTVIFSLGTTLSGGGGSAAEVLQLLGQKGSDTRSRAPKLATTAASSSLGWWCGRLNDLFALLSDPAIFTDTRGQYQPQKQLNSMLTVEQLFRRVSSIQTNWRDAHARRVLLFTVLDTLERLTGRNLETLCSLPHADKVLHRLRAAIPPDAQTLLLPSAVRALAALREVQDGFFLQDALTHSVMVPDKSGEMNSMSLDVAAALYVKVLRNATHGHGSNKDRARHRTDTMLAQHNGSVPHDLALLGYLYLLEMLAFGSDLIPKLYRHGRD